MKTNIRILLVDDIVSTDTDVQNALEKIGVVADIKFISPKSRISAIENILPKPDELNDFDLALIDIELYSPKSGKYDLANLSGGTDVLPYLRKHSPWIPVIAASKLFSEETPAMHSLAGSFGFDGQIPRKMFPTETITREIWNIVVEQATLLRKRAALKTDYDYEKAKKIKDDNILTENIRLEEFLQKNYPDFKKLLKDCFYYANQIFLYRIGGGYSGAVTLKAKVIEKNIEKSTTGNWLVKISKNPSKLNREIKAHQKMIRSGQEYARTVPLLWENILVQNKIGILVYQFAEGTITASEFLKNNNANKLCFELEEMFAKIYKNEKIERNKNNTIYSIIRDWYDIEELKSAVQQLTNNKCKRELENILNGDTADGIPGIVSNSYCWCHGDLHLKNILIGERNVLIDFARSKFGPIAIDFAKFVTDLLISDESCRENNIVFKNPDSNKRIFKALSPLMKIIEFSDHDIIIFDLFIKFYLSLALSYPSTEENVKKWIKTIIK